MGLVCISRRHLFEAEDRDVNALGASVFAGLSLLLLLSSRRWAAVWMVGGALFLTQQQSIEIAGINLTAIRLLEIVGMARIVVRQESFDWARLDTAVMVLYAYAALVFVLRSDSDHAYAIGGFVDALLCYVIFRALLKDLDDIAGFLQRFLLLLLPYVGLLVIEAVTMQNPFGTLGGATWGTLRDGRLRTMGSFRNPSLLGTVAATFLQLYIGMVLAGAGRARALAVLGGVLCLVILALANSGGPIAATAVGLLGWCCWWFRRHMAVARRLAAGTLLLVALAMDAPVWYLLERVSFLTGGGGWHRAHLLNRAWEDLDRWWLAGIDIRDTAHWFPYTMKVNNGGADITNAFVDFGLRGGVFAIVLFILLIVRAYRVLGEALTTSTDCGGRSRALMLWGLGCMLAAHIATLMSITYFDQIYVVWYMHLAAITAATSAAPALVASPLRVHGAGAQARSVAIPMHPALPRDQV